MHVMDVICHGYIDNNPIIIGIPLFLSPTMIHELFLGTTQIIYLGVIYGHLMKARSLTFNY